MKKIIALISALAVFSACALLSPYSITFTTPNESVVNPQYNTLDLAVNSPTLAYISMVQCDDELPVELLPVLTDDMQVSSAHNLTLELLADQSPGSKCEVTVTVFDQTTTASARKSITLYVLEMPEEEVVEDVEEGEATEEVADETTEGGEVCDDGTACPAEENTEETTDTTDETTDTTSDNSSTEESGA